MFQRRKQRDFNEEIKAHLQLEVDRLREDGLSETEAQLAARRKFGNISLAEERYFEAGRAMWWDHLTRDFNYAFRLMRKNWVLSMTISLTRALGFGAKSVVFIVVRAVVLRPLEYPQ
jgi:hypothetical protein